MGKTFAPAERPVAEKVTSIKHSQKSSMASVTDLVVYCESTVKMVDQAPSGCRGDAVAAARDTCWARSAGWCGAACQAALSRSRRATDGEPVRRPGHLPGKRCNLRRREGFSMSTPSARPAARQAGPPPQTFPDGHDPLRVRLVTDGERGGSPGSRRWQAPSEYSRSGARTGQVQREDQPPRSGCRRGERLPPQAAAFSCTSPLVPGIEVSGFYGGSRGGPDRGNKFPSA